MMDKPIILLNNKNIYLYKKSIQEELYTYISKYLKKVSLQSSYSDELDIYILDEYSIISLILSGDEAITEFYEIMNKYSYNEIPVSIIQDIDNTKNSLRSVELELGKTEVIMKILEGDLSFLQKESFKKHVKYDNDKETYKFPRNKSLKIIKDLAEEKVNIEFPTCSISDRINFSLKNNTTLRYYQEEAFETLKNRNKGLMLMPISSGKNYVAIRMIDYIGKKTLILCENKSISSRWKKDLEYMLDSKDIILVENENFKVSDITICSYDLIRRNDQVFESLNSSEWGVILYDNAHKAVTEKAVEVLYLRSQYKFALASSLNRSDDKGLELGNLFRRSIYNITSQELLKKLYQKQLKYYKVDLKDIGYNTNQFITYILKKYPNKRVLIVSYGVTALEAITKDLNIDVITGSTNGHEREEIIEKYNDKKINKLCITNLIENYRVNDVDIMIALNYRGQTEIEDDFRIGTLISTIDRLKNEQEALKFYLINDQKEKEIVEHKELYLKKYGAIEGKLVLM